jgi:hypothetical protein
MEKTHTLCLRIALVALLMASLSFAQCPTGGAAPPSTAPSPAPYVCTATSLANIQSGVYPSAFLAAALMGIIIAITYMLGTIINNPKLNLWCKTELLQLFVSIAVVIITFQIITAFCAINLVDIGNLFGFSGGTGQISLYSGAEGYLVSAGDYIHMVLNSARYTLGAYNILETFGRYLCLNSNNPISGFLNIIFCLFGNFLSIGGGTGTAVSPDAGHSLAAPGLSVAFNSLQFSYLSTLNYLFILKYIYSGFALFFLPLGIFLRSVPYMRTLGSLLMSVSICFVTVYPLVLSVFYLDLLSASPVLTPVSPALLYACEDIGSKVGVGDMFSSSLAGNVFSVTNANAFNYHDLILGWGFLEGPATTAVGDQSFEIIKLAGNSFLIGVFIPSLALLSAVAAVSYVNRFLGEEIDLSRIVQMV